MTYLRNTFYIFGVTLFAPLSAVVSTSTWIAQSPDGDMNVSGNWSSSQVPHGIVQVIFDSSFENVDLNPTQSDDDFSVCSIYFPNSASPFAIHFNNHTVALNGIGIIGSQTNATIHATNINNASNLSDQFSFNRNNPSFSGSAALNITNAASQLSNTSNATLSNIDNQFYVYNSFSILKGGSLTLANTGSDSSHGTGGNQISCMTAYQGQLNNTCTIEDDVTIAVFNSGTYSGSNLLTGNNIGLLINGQYYNADAFVAGDALDFSVTNNGVNSGTSEGGSNIGVVGSSQINFANTCSLGESNAIIISNYGVNSGNSGTNGSNILNIGQLYEHQLYVGAQFVAGDHLSLVTTNIGIDSGSGQGQTYVGSITTTGSDGDQVRFNDSCSVGKSSTFLTQNSGTCTGSKGGGAVTSVGQVSSNQMVFTGQFQAGDFLNLSITNSGMDSSYSINSNGIGTVSSTQLLFGSTAVIQDNATIQITNQGNFSGDTTNPISYSGVVGNAQFKATGNFESGDSFYLGVENLGQDTGSGAGSNLIGSIGAEQVYFTSSCSLGDEAKILISNVGINSNLSLNNQTGYVNLSQFKVGGNFAAGTNLNVSINNSSENTGNSNNNVGYVSGWQALFNGTVTLGDGSIISTTNNGTVEGVQLQLDNGFTVSSGKVTFQVINEGIRFSNIGFLIQGVNAGGNANIVLKNTRLDIDTTGSPFTIGELNGDSLSIVKSTPPLIIDTDSSTNGLFLGVIENNLTPLTVTKQGPGIQTLAGINTYTGLTTIQEGILSINGSVIGDVTVNSGGTLKGSGSIGGQTTINNGAVLSPGNSIGTITLQSLVLDSGSTTVIEIDPTGSSNRRGITIYSRSRCLSSSRNI